MSREDITRAFPLVFGTAGTQSSVAATAGTATSNPYALPASDYSIQLSLVTTGTSSGSASVIVEASNDNLNWIPMGSASATAVGTASDATAFRASGGFQVTGQRYAYARARPTVTGTGAAQVWLGS